MNVYFCTDCGQPADPPACPHCGSHTVHMAGDLHLTMIGLDVYVNIYKDALDNYFLIVKKPSGQVEVRVHDEDILEPGKDGYDPEDELEDQVEAGKSMLRLEEQKSWTNYQPGTCPHCGQELMFGDWPETPPIYCDNCRIGWDSPDEVEREYMFTDPSGHFMDSDGRPKGYELEQWHAEMNLEAQYHEEAGFEAEAQDERK